MTDYTPEEKARIIMDGIEAFKGKEVLPHSEGLNRKQRRAQKVIYNKLVKQYGIKHDRSN